MLHLSQRVGMAALLRRMPTTATGWLLWVAQPD